MTEIDYYKNRCEELQKSNENLRKRVKELEKEVEKAQDVIVELARFGCEFHS